jgi:hypothetical protein
VKNQDEISPSSEPKIEVKDVKELENKNNQGDDIDDQSFDSRQESESVISLNIANSNQTVHKTHCGHYFHKKCLEVWCESRHNCPMCRNLIVTEYIYLNLDEE